MGTPVVCQTCGGKIELFKTTDEVWAKARLVRNATVCIKCVEGKLGRPLTPDDIDMNFPWWGAARPEYYTGVQDGLEKKPAAESEGLYKLGYELGARIAANPE